MLEPAGGGAAADLLGWRGALVGERWVGSRDEAERGRFGVAEAAEDSAPADAGVRERGEARRRVE